METIIVLGKILGLSFFITKFSPIQWVLEALQPKVDYNLPASEQKRPLLIFIYNIVSILTGCFSCCSFWTGTLLYGFWFGISAYVIAYLYNQILSPFIEKIRLQ
jgi:hypothetical protein